MSYQLIVQNTPQGIRINDRFVLSIIQQFGGRNRGRFSTQWCKNVFREVVNLEGKYGTDDVRPNPIHHRSLKRIKLKMRNTNFVLLKHNGPIL